VWYFLHTKKCQISNRRYKTVVIKDTGSIAEKWARVTPGRQSDYEAGVKAPSADWKSQTAAAESNWSDGVSQAAANRSFSKGVNKAGTEKWQRKTIDVGIPRWGAGVRAGTTDYQTGFDPYRATLASLTLPPHYAKGDPRNIERVSVVVSALRNKKLSM
jgi:hypothetical protein